MANAQVFTCNYGGSIKNKLLKSGEKLFLKIEDGKISGTVANNTPITVAYTNTLEGSVPTGIDLASGAPLLMSAAAGLAALIAIRKKKED